MKNKQLPFLTALLMISMLSFGQSWDLMTTGTTFRLYDVHFPAGQSDIGFAACMDGNNNDPGKLIKTTDKGDTWTQILPVSGTMDGLETVFFTSSDTGYIAGWNDYFAKTTDGGTTWTELTLSTSGKVFADIEFWDADNGVALSSSPHTWDAFIYVTSDGGDTWTLATGLTGGGAADLAYSDANTVFAVGGFDQKIWKSTDGGSTWSLNNTGNAAQFLLGVDFEGDYGVTVGSMGDRYVTTDQGASWTYSSKSTSQNYEGIHVFNSDSTIYGGMMEEMYKTLDGGSTWITEYDGTGTNHFYQVFFTSNNYGFAAGSGGLLLRRDAPLSSDFYADNTTTCVGSTVTFYDNGTGADSWLWTFDGGTPATSTDENPTVTYAATGTYDVELTVTNNSGSETETKYDYMTVLETPEQSDTPVGDDMICTDNAYEYTTNEVDFAEDYEWEIDPANAGTFTVSMNEANLLVADDYSGDFTIRVRATNLCGNGDWSDNLEGTIYESPIAYSVEGGGGYCLGGDGVEITQDGSQTDIEYELYLDGEATGITVTGTGSEISFGLVTEEGYYSATASNDNCETLMTNQIHVFIDYPPLEPGTPTGPAVVCEETSTDYTSDGSDDADSYEWVLSPEEAGTITAEGLNATVEWNAEFAGLAYVSLYGINDCGDGNPSEELEVSKGAPNPQIEGEGLVCDWSDEVYDVTENEGSTYTWEVTGGTILEGQGTYMITVSWDGEGDGTISVEEETVGGCTGSSEVFEVMIDDCTTIGENEKSELSISPNPANEYVRITSEQQISTLAIYSLTGKLVEKIDINSTSVNVSTSSYKSGIYIIRIITPNGSLSKRLIIE